MPNRLWLLIGVIPIAQACASPATGPNQLETPLTISAQSLPTPRRIILRPGDLVLAADRSDIPPIFASEELFVSAQAGSLEWDDEELVVGLEIDDDTRAYAVRLLSLHEVVNDVVGGQPLALTWCPLCYSAIVYDRIVERELTFAASGYLYQNNLVMYDHQSETLWSQALGVGLRGAQRSVQLRRLPSSLTTFGAWRTDHPETLVLSALRLGAAPGSIADPYVGYYSSGAAGLTGRSNPDTRLPVKELIAGMAIGDSALAIPLETLREAGLIEADLDGFPIVVTYDSRLGSLNAFLRRTAGEMISFQWHGEEGIRDLHTFSTWDLEKGVAVSGVRAGLLLERVPTTLLFWFAWIDLHPDSAIYIP